MSQNTIFGPLFVMLGLTFVVWVYMYVRRIAFLNRSGIDPQDLSEPGRLAQLSPAAVTNPSDNLKNLFEIPVLFYALVLYLFVTGQVDGAFVAGAWAFALLRVLHSAVHCTINIVMLRFAFYLASTLVLWWMALRAALHHFGT